MYGKLIISGELETLTGLHIGAGPALQLTAADYPVVRDRRGLPYVPGSSLKGKLRTLLARALAQRWIVNDPGHDAEEVIRLFGAPAVDDRPAQAGRLIFCDAPLVSAPGDYLATEIKHEAAIDRATAELQVRSLERVVPGARFALRVIYTATEGAEAGTDLQNLAGAMELLTMDSLGGNGSRGSGRVAFRNMQVGIGYGDAFDDQDLAFLNEVFHDDALNL